MMIGYLPHAGLLGGAGFLRRGPVRTCQSASNNFRDTNVSIRLLTAANLVEQPQLVMESFRWPPVMLLRLSG
jgi:hypothetical protein